jgi:hypothetical protein
MWKRISNFLIAAGKIAGGATFLFGIIYGIFQYFESRKEKQVAETLALYRQFNNTPLVAYREKIYLALAEHQEDIAKATVDEKEMEKTMLRVVKTGGIANQLILVMDFFDGLVFCVSRNICDPETALDLFYGRSRELYTTFYQYIQIQRREASTDFALGLQTFAEMRKRQPPAKAAANPATKTAAKAD